MLGWHFIVLTRRVQLAGLAVENYWLARWDTGVGGTKWLDQLCSIGAAVHLGGNGYPITYVIPAGTFRKQLSRGIPDPDSPVTIGDDYVIPAGWRSNLEVDVKRLDALPSDTLLSVEAWDQS